MSIHSIAPNTLEIGVKSPAAAKASQPGQFFRVQRYNNAELSHDTKGIALTGINVNPQKGTLSFIVLQTGASSLLCKNLKKGEEISLMGPTGEATEIPENQNVILIGGGFGNAVLFSIGKSMRKKGCRVIFIAAYRHPSSVFKKQEIERAADQVIWIFETTDKNFSVRPIDHCFEGTLLNTLETYTKKPSPSFLFPASKTQRILTIGTAGMMNTIRDFLNSSKGKSFSPCSIKIAGVNSSMQCMMKEICGRCLQRHQDPTTGLETFVFSCANQDQPLEKVDFSFLQNRLYHNVLLEKMAIKTINLSNKS